MANLITFKKYNHSVTIYTDTGFDSKASGFLRHLYRHMVIVNGAVGSTKFSGTFSLFNENSKNINSVSELMNQMSGSVIVNGQHGNNRFVRIVKNGNLQFQEMSSSGSISTFLQADGSTSGIKFIDGVDIIPSA